MATRYAGKCRLWVYALQGERDHFEVKIKHPEHPAWTCKVWLLDIERGALRPTCHAAYDEAAKAAICFARMADPDAPREVPPAFRRAIEKMFPHQTPIHIRSLTTT